MLKDCYDTMILGASFLGLGAALNSENCVVTESGGLFGAEFINNYKICEPKPAVVKTKTGVDFLNQLTERRLVSGRGEIYQAPAIYVMSRYLKEKPMDILLMTEFMGVEKKNGWYHVTVYHTGGFETIRAKRIWDTTTFGRGHNKAGSVSIKKSLNAIIFNPESAFLKGLHYNSASGLYVYSLPVAPETERPEAIEYLCGQERIFAKNNMRISSIASEFSYSMTPVLDFIENDFVWNPSIAHPNLIEAFDEGLQMAERI
jgi:hypothetical protein